MLLNRSPQGLDYWMGEILKLADLAAHGRLKGELVKIVEEQRGPDISQAFVIRRLDDDPGRPPSLVHCPLKTLDAAQLIANTDRSIRLSWSRRALYPARPGLRPNPDGPDDAW